MVVEGSGLVRRQPYGTGTEWENMGDGSELKVIQWRENKGKRLL